MRCPIVSPSSPSALRSQALPPPRTTVLGLVLLGALWAPSAWAHSVVGGTPDDLALANRVQTLLLADRAFQAHNTDLVVSAQQGQVNLSGWIAFEDNAPRARVLAAGIAGVGGVTSNFKSWSTHTDPRLLPE